jgi:predicted kinase
MNWYKKILTSDYESDNYNSMNKEFIIMRGIPSSGKSYLANELSGDAGGVFSADDYHMDQSTGEYNWKPENVKKAHKWNHDRVKNAISQGISPVIIDNTHVKKWELMALKPLVELAQNRGYNVRIEEPNPNWFHWDTAFDADALFERNKKTHNVPRESIQRMVDSYDRGISVDDILNYEK